MAIPNDKLNDNVIIEIDIVVEFYLVIYPQKARSDGLTVPLRSGTHYLIKLLVKISNGLIAYHVTHTGDRQIFLHKQTGGVAYSSLHLKTV